MDTFIGFCFGYASGMLLTAFLIFKLYKTKL